MHGVLKRGLKWGVASCCQVVVGLGLSVGLGLAAPQDAWAASKSASKSAAKTPARAAPKATAGKTVGSKSTAKAAPPAKAKVAPAKAHAAKPAPSQTAKATAASNRAGKGLALAAKGAAAQRQAKAGKSAGKGAHVLALAAKGGKNAKDTRLSVVQRIRPGRAAARLSFAAARPAPRLSMGQLAGLRDVADPLDLKSSVALVLDQDTHEVLLSKNDHAVLPIASITKLMTALLVSEAGLPLDEQITITEADAEHARGSSSRLSVGATLTRAELLHLTLMSSENRAAHALGRSFPGGIQHFVGLMNAKAAMLGMKDTRYVEPTGLSNANRASAMDLATLVDVAARDPLLSQLSVSPGYEITLGERVLHYANTNRLVHSPDWQIGLQKTGYIADAGRCLVMQARVAGRNLIMVLLDASDKNSRLADAERLRRWVETEHASHRTPSLWQGAQVSLPH